MLNSSTLKLISFELCKDLELRFYFEAALLAEAYQLFVTYHISFTRLNEFVDENSQKLLSFSRVLSDFLQRKQLAVPAFAVESRAGISLKATPLGVFLLNLLQLKLKANLEAISSVFTSSLVKDDLAKRHAWDAKLRQNLHAYIDLNTYVDKLFEFEAWQNFAAFTLPELASLAEWLQIIKSFFVDLKVWVPQNILILLDEYFLPAHELLRPLAYQEFLEHFNMFLEDTWVEPVDKAFYPLQEEIPWNNPFVPGRLIQEYKIGFSVPVMDSPSFVAAQYQCAHREEGKRYKRLQAPDVLAQPQNLNLREQAGGAAILSQQAACPFKAFGHFQLKLQGLVNDEAWLSAKLKGIAIHRILEKIWDSLKSQRNLLNLSEDELGALVRSTTSQVLFALSHAAQFFLPQSLAQLEIRRLTQLILAWLMAEKKRPEFKVHALEAQSLAYLGDLVVKLRLDRVDELANGQRIVIDYKTGSVNIKEWVSEPLGDVQLPLYVLTTNAAGALFAEVNHHLHFSGIVAEDVANFSEVKAAEQVSGRSWEDLKIFWQKNIHALAKDISQGMAQVKPEPGACDYCDLQSVCRIREL